MTNMSYSRQPFSVNLTITLRKSVERTSQYRLLCIPALEANPGEYISRFIIREYTTDPELLIKEQGSYDEIVIKEKEAAAELLALSNVNLQEAYEVGVHLRIVRTFIESVLRYGLPADYFFVLVKVSSISFSPIPTQN